MTWGRADLPTPSKHSYIHADPSLNVTKDHVALLKSSPNNSYAYGCNSFVTELHQLLPGKADRRKGRGFETSTIAQSHSCP